MKNFINRKYIMNIKQELAKSNKVLSPNSKLIREYKDTLHGLSSYQKDSAIGHLLGDARIEKTKSNNGCLLKFEWGDLNKEYAFLVYEEFKSYILTEPRKQQRINKLGNTNITWCFQTIAHKDFDFLADMFLQDNKKKLSQEVYNNLSPRVLSRWFMDDGGMNGSHSRGIQFNTQSFTVDEVNNLCEALNNKYQFEAWVVIKKNKPIINIPAKHYNKFVEITKDHMLDSMKKKLIMR